MINFLCNIVSYGDSKSPCVSGNDKDEVIESLEQGSSTLFKGFTGNMIKHDAEKWHLLVSTNANFTIKIGSLI